MKQTRTQNVAKNIYISIITQVVNLAINFISRTIFIRILGLEYLGISGLFSNILMILSFAELGIGNAIIYNMYKPLAIGDTKKVSSLMTLYIL
jgi:O-antigen/teichoic acid export membrane protein